MSTHQSRASSPIIPPLDVWSHEALTCSRGERGNGKWIGKTSRLCPPSSSTNDSERLQKITDGAQSIHNHRVEDSRTRGRSVLSLSLSSALALSLSAAPQMPPGRKPSIRQACSAPSNLQSTIHTSRVEGAIEAVNYHQRQHTTPLRCRHSPAGPRYVHQKDKRAICDRRPCFFLAKCLPPSP